MIKVLVVDDDDLVCELIRVKFATLGYQVSSASNGKAALAELIRERPDIILLDQMMPVMSGKEFLLRIKANPRLRTIPVIMISLRDCAEDIAAAKHQGAAGYIVKPFVMEMLIERIQEILRPQSAVQINVPDALKKVAVTVGLPLAAYAQTTMAQTLPNATPAADDPYRQAMTAHEQNDHDVAVQILQRLVEVEPQNTDNWLRLGLEYSHMDKWDNAEAALNKAIALAPDYTDAQDALKNVKRWKADMLAAATLTPRLTGSDITVPTERKNGQQQISFAASSSHSWYKSNMNPDGGETLIVAGYSPHPKAYYLAQIEVGKRFGQTDITGGIQADWRLTSNVSAYLGGTVSKKPSFRENWSVRAGGSFRPIKEAEFSLDSRVSKYGSATIFSATPKVALSPRSNRAMLTAGWINVWDEIGVHRSGWSLRGDARPSDKVNLHLGIARYPDTEAGITRRISVRFAGAAVSIRHNLRLSLGYEKERRQLSSSLNRVTFGLRWTIDNRMR